MLRGDIKAGARRSMSTAVFALADHNVVPDGYHGSTCAFRRLVLYITMPAEVVVIAIELLED